MDNNCIIIDNGSAFCRVGFSSNKIPKHSFPSSVIQKKYSRNQTQDNTIIKYPLQNSQVVDFDIMECVWHNAFYKYLITNPEDSSILTTSYLNTSRIEKEKITQIMFETFNIAQFTIQIQSILSLLSCGKTTGFVIDSGNDTTYFVPIYEGCKININDNYCHIAGKSCSKYLNHLIQQSNQQQVKDLEILNYIKEKYCYISLDFKKELAMKQQQQIIYHLPDGTQLEIGNQIFQAPEIMFNPQLHFNQTLGYHQLTQNSLEQIDLDLRIELLKNLIISGGNTLINGFSERFQFEFKRLNNQFNSGELNLVKSQKFSAWVGGCIFTNLAQYSCHWISRYEYEEYGPNIVQRKCY